MWLRWITIVSWLVVAEVSFAQDPTQRIDQILLEAGKSQGLEPAALCSDEQFARRAYLDLRGRIPTAIELQQFLANPDRQRLIDELLASDEFPTHWSNLWTTQWYGYTNEDEVGRAEFQQWLEESLRQQRSYERIVHEIVTASGESAFHGPVNFYIRHNEQPVVKVTRSFLGIRLDCARCHDHPFDRWTEEDFQKMDRFFSGLQFNDVSRGNTRLTDAVMQAEPAELPRFLSGAVPKTTQWRSEFAMFLTKSRPFARNFANRIWYHLMGRGVVHPVDDFSRDNPASHPQLLEYLTDESRNSNFDIKNMIRLICRSEAYQRVSKVKKDAAVMQQLFLARTIKPLTPGQWYSSFCVATQKAPNPNEEREFVRQYLSDAIEGDFSATWEYKETLQGLMSALLDKSSPPPGNIEELFISILNRRPIPEELKFFQGSSSREISYVLLHSNEFSVNH
jgi:hypothetical protein